MTRYFPGWVIFAGLWGWMLFSGCGQQHQKKARPANVKTATAKVVTAVFYNEINGFGTIRATDALDLEAKFDGIVHFKNLKGRITKGTVLYTMTGEEINLKKENLQKALAIATTQYNYYKQYYEAKKVLAEKSYLSRIEFEKVTGDLHNAQSALNAAQYALDYFLSMTCYKAPFDGFLDYLQVPQGEDAVAGQLLGTFQNDDRVKLVATFYGNPAKLKQNNISVDIDGKIYKGKLNYLEKAVNPSSGGHTLWINLKDRNHQLKSGSYVSFSFLMNAHKSAAVPKAAIIWQHNKYFVIEVKNNKYTRISVKPGLERNGLTEIKEGLNEGDVVLTKGVFEVFYGNLRKTMQVDD